MIGTKKNEKKDRKDWRKGMNKRDKVGKSRERTKIDKINVI